MFLPSLMGFDFAKDAFVGLLDLYPNATAAYSVRKLRTLYTGSAIRVRRSSDNTEQDIGFTALGALDTSALTSFCGSGNGFVTTWYDQSGNARNATQSTAANQPQIVSSGSLITINSLPAVQFDGSNDNLKSSSYTAISQPITLFLVNRYIATTPYPYLIDIGGDKALGYISGAGGKNDMYFGVGLKSTTNYAANTNFLWYALANGSSSQISINGETIVSGNAGTGNSSSITIGSNLALTTGAFANSNYSEFIFYPSNQSSNLTGIRSNINTYYGIY
jgi:hypothetical protein